MQLTNSETPADPGIHMYNQAKYGAVDVITGDYLAGISPLSAQKKAIHMKLIRGA
jgi:hypothetical protein